jgi:D-glycero-D-manno-heptose 1,7-bisphosphate phosphatase
MLKPAIFFDRDGVLNIEKGYVYKISDFEWIDGAKEAIQYMNQKDFLVFVITNQSGIARNYYTEKDVIKIHQFMSDELKKINAKIDEFFYSPWHPEGANKDFERISHLRKPSPGMLELAQTKWPINKTLSFLIGDQITDIQAAENFGIEGYLFEGDNLLDFVKKLLETG